MGKVVDLAQPGLIKPNERTSADLRLATKRRTQPASPLNSRRTHHLGENVERNVQSFGVEWKTTGGVATELQNGFCHSRRSRRTYQPNPPCPSTHHIITKPKPSPHPNSQVSGAPRPARGRAPHRHAAGRGSVLGPRERDRKASNGHEYASATKPNHLKYIYIYMHEYVYSYYILCNC